MQCRISILMDFTITEVHTNRQRAENDSCLTCVSTRTECFCWDKLKLTAQCAALSLCSQFKQIIIQSGHLTYKDHSVTADIRVQRTQDILWHNCSKRSWLMLHSAVVYNIVLSLLLWRKDNLGTCPFRNECTVERFHPDLTFVKHDTD